MKKILLILVVTAFTGYTAYSQAGFNIGIKAGLNLSKLGGDATDVKSKAGFHAGLYAGAKFTKFGVDIEALFSGQGTEDDITGAKLNTDYVLIPVLAKLYIVSGLNIYAGPQFGFVIKSEIDDPSFGTVDIKDFTNSTDVSIVVGAGFEISKFRAGARYNIGISNWLDDPTGLSAGIDDKFTNQVFQLYVGFNLIGK